MASRSNVRNTAPEEPVLHKAFGEDEAPQLDDDVDDFNPPDELDDEAVYNVPTSTYSASAGLSLEELNERDIDEERDERNRALLSPPAGTWEKPANDMQADERERAWKYEKRVNTADRAEGDIDPAGRTMLNFWGKTKPLRKDGITYEPTLFIRISPDVRYKAEAGKEHELDNSYKLWLSAKELYLSMYGERGKIIPIKNMLLNDEYLVRCMSGDAGLVPLQFLDKDQQRMRARRRIKR